MRHEPQMRVIDGELLECTMYLPLRETLVMLKDKPACDHTGKRFTVLRQLSVGFGEGGPHETDYETGSMFEVETEDGERVFAFVEEITEDW